MDPLRDTARRDPGGEAVAVPADDGRSWSWRELDERVDAAALHLASAGVGPGSLVATLLGPSPGALVLLHAVPRVGGILVPLHPGWTLPEVRRALAGVGAPVLPAPADARVRAADGRAPGGRAPVLLAAPDARVPELRSALPGVGVVPVEELTAFVGAASGEPGGGWRPADVPPDPDAPVALVLTSGSTGAPRPVPLTRGNLLASARGVAERLRLDVADRWLATLAVAHVGGLALLHRGAVVGSTTVFDGAFDAERFLELADAGEVTHASLVPVMLRRLLEARGGRPAPRGLRCVLVGGAATPRALLDQALDARWPVALTWGMTEATSQVATAPPERVRSKPGSVGRPLADVTVRVVGADGRERPRGTVGELVVAGPTVAPLHSVVAAGGWHRTGDLGLVDTDGDLWITGRALDRIVTGGVTVEPAEVEAALLAHPLVAEVAVIGVADPEWGERIVAFVVRVGGSPGVPAEGPAGAGPGVPFDAGSGAALDAGSAAPLDDAAGAAAGASPGAIPDVGAGVPLDDTAAGASPGVPAEAPAGAGPGAPPDAAALDAFSRERLSAARRPRAWVFVDALPRNANGKVDRRALADRLADRPGDAGG
jgi:o-succinylbenzoate---CoA ligase